MTCCSTCDARAETSALMGWRCEGYHVAQDDTFVVPASSEFAGWKTGYGPTCSCNDWGPTCAEQRTRAEGATVRTRFRGFSGASAGATGQPESGRGSRLVENGLARWSRLTINVGALLPEVNDDVDATVLEWTHSGFGVADSVEMLVAPAALSAPSIGGALSDVEYELSRIAFGDTYAVSLGTALLRDRVDFRGPADLAVWILRNTDQIGNPAPFHAVCAISALAVCDDIDLDGDGENGGGDGGGGDWLWCALLIEAMTSVGDLAGLYGHAFGHCLSNCLIALYCGDKAAIVVGLGVEVAQALALPIQKLLGADPTKTGESAMQQSDFWDNALGRAAASKAPKNADPPAWCWGRCAALMGGGLMGGGTEHKEGPGTNRPYGPYHGSNPGNSPTWGDVLGGPPANWGP